MKLGPGLTPEARATLRRLQIHGFLDLLDHYLLQVVVTAALEGQRLS